MKCFVHEKVLEYAKSIEDQLSPCPCCGKPAQFEIDHDCEGDRYLAIKCCICEVQRYTYTKDVAGQGVFAHEMVDQWNKRQSREQWLESNDTDWDAQFSGNVKI